MEVFLYGKIKSEVILTCIYLCLRINSLDMRVKLSVRERVEGFKSQSGIYNINEHAMLTNIASAFILQPLKGLYSM